MAKKPAAGSLTATDIFEQLYGASNSSLVFSGLIDKSDDDPSMILFARGIDCQEWKKIPTSAIEKVQFVQTAQCKDHVHPLVHIFLKEPQSPDGHAFAAVAHSHPAATPGGGLVAPTPSLSSVVGPLAHAHSSFAEPCAPHPCPNGGRWVQDAATGQWCWRCWTA
jgi:hypothetical protein